MKFCSASLFIIFISTFFIYSAYSQSIISGLIKDAETKETIPYAVIRLENTKKYEISNLSGFFKISSPLTIDNISISSLGYRSQTIETIKSDSFLTIYLQPSSMNLGEVNVYANQSGIEGSSFETLKKMETYSLAGFTKDIFRSVQMLPGVSSNNAATAQYNVRGGTIDENLMLINGIELAEPYHIKVFPFTSVGIFNIDMVQRINFSAGGFSAEYGDALSSVLNVDYRKANNDSICGRVNLGMIDLGILAEIPFSKKASLLIAGRHSYLDPVIKLVDTDEKISIRYYDIQGKFDYKINNRNSFSILGIYSQDHDKVGPEQSNSHSTFIGRFKDDPLTIENYRENNFLLDSKYNDIILAFMSKHNISGKILLRSELSFYNENEKTPRTQTKNTLNEYSAPELFYRNNYSWENIKDSKLTTYEYKLSSEFLIAQNHKLKTGGFIRLSEYDYTNTKSTVWDVYNNTDNYPDTLEYILRPDELDKNSITIFKADAIKAGGYLSYQWQFNPKLVFKVGGRIDYLNLNKEFDFSPRFNSSYVINSKWKANAAWGIFYKSPLMKQMKYSYATNDNTSSQQATHYILGLERKYNHTTFKAEAYYKKYDDLIPAWRSSMGEMFYETKENNAEGYAKGIELEFITTHPRFDIWFIYTLGSTKEKLTGTSTYYSRYTDQRHTISSLWIFKMRKQKQFDIKVTYGSGYTYKKQIFDATTNQWIYENEITTEALPYYSSIDVRYKKTYKIRENPLQVYFDVMNILNRKNAIGHRYGYRNNAPTEENESVLGILPTFGIIYDF